MTQTVVSIKRAPYSTGASRVAWVGYVILGNNVSFTALQPSCQGSSINYAEDIIHSICQVEGIDNRRFTFFDLQTGTMYGSSTYGHTPCSFQYDEIIFGENGQVRQWFPTKCPSEVVEIFRGYIGRNPTQIRSTGELFK